MSNRRHFITAVAAASSGWPAIASPRRTVLPSMTDGPFYPPTAWRRQRSVDWDADLTHVAGTAAPARGEHLALALQVADANGRIVDGAEVEIWQCDALKTYHHPGVRAAAGEIDAGFAGFGAARADARGELAFRTIRPVPYPGRTPHIHVKLRHASFGEWTSQLFIEGDAGNARDFLWRSVAPEGQAALAMKLAPASPDAAADGLRWQARHLLVVPA
jgi:protocatechuate 3,4-dioxygenase beta subunit